MVSIVYSHHLLESISNANRYVSLFFNLDVDQSYAHDGYVGYRVNTKVKRHAAYGKYSQRMCLPNAHALA